jgi:hypothetical protein
MSMNTATVYDFTPAQFRRTTNKQASEPLPAGILDDVADGIEAIHQCANIAGFTERPRAFIFALATAAHSHGQDQLELYDKELAELQNCSTKTVQRQRADYIREAKTKDFDLVEIIEGDYDKTEGEYEPTRYRFHIGDVIGQIVAEARSSKFWHESDRRKQREAVKRAAQVIHDEIPRSESRSRKKRRPRLATSEIETCQKVAQTKLRRMKELAAKLPPQTRAALMNAEDPGQLYQWWLELRGEMDDFFGVNSSQSIEVKENNRDSGQFVHHPPAVAVDTEPEIQGATVEGSEGAGLVSDSSLVNTWTEPEELPDWWTALEDRLNAPPIRRVEVELHPPDPPPGDENCPAVTTTELEEPPADGKEHVSVAKGRATCEAFRTGAGVWRNTYFDMPVTVTGERGTAPDGRRYVSVSESQAGVPLDEIEFLNEELSGGSP